MCRPGAGAKTHQLNTEVVEYINVLLSFCTQLERLKRRKLVTGKGVYESAQKFIPKIPEMRHFAPLNTGTMLADLRYKTCVIRILLFYVNKFTVNLPPKRPNVHTDMRAL